MTMVPLDALISVRDRTLNHLAISQHVNKITMATTTTTTPNAPNLLTLVTDTESIVSSIDSLTSYLDSELAPSTGVYYYAPEFITKLISLYIYS